MEHHEQVPEKSKSWLIFRKPKREKKLKNSIRIIVYDVKDRGLHSTLVLFIKTNNGQQKRNMYLEEEKTKNGFQAKEFIV